MSAARWPEANRKNSAIGGDCKFDFKKRYAGLVETVSQAKSNAWAYGGLYAAWAKGHNTLRQEEIV